MLIEMLRAAIFAGLPVCIIAYIIISGAKRKTRLADFANTKDLALASKKMASDYKENKKSDDFEHKNQLVLNKWMYFGGGYYGLMALITYVVIEVKEIYAFCAKLLEHSWSEAFTSITFNMLVDLFVNAILNLVDAFTWFIYWNKHIDMSNAWLWLIASYLGYMAGAQLVQRFPRKFSFFDLLRNKPKT